MGLLVWLEIDAALRSASSDPVRLTAPRQVYLDPPGQQLEHFGRDERPRPSFALMPMPEFDPVTLDHVRPPRGLPAGSVQGVEKLGTEMLELDVAFFIRELSVVDAVRERDKREARLISNVAAISRCRTQQIDASPGQGTERSPQSRQDRCPHVSVLDDDELRRLARFHTSFYCSSQNSQVRGGSLSESASPCARPIGVPNVPGPPLSGAYR